MQKNDDWSSEEPLDDIPEDKIIAQSDIGPIDIFRLAKKILTWCVVLFVLMVIGYVLSPLMAGKEEMKQVWTFSSQALYGIITLIIGFYFGGNIAKDKS